MKLSVVFLAVMCSLVGLGVSPPPNQNTTTTMTSSISTILNASLSGSGSGGSNAHSSTSGARSTIFTSSGGNVLLFLTVSIVLYIPLLMK